MGGSMRKNSFKDQVAGYFNQHCAPLYINYTRGDESHHYVYSAFILSIDDEWFLITAGHCIRDIENNKKKGYLINRARLIDSGGINPAHKETIPFDYEAAHKGHLDDDKYDYGFIHIANYYRELLKANNIVALDEEVWDKQPEEPECYFLLGAPDQFKELTEEKIKLVTTLHSVEKCESVPEEFEDTDAPTFYGKIYLDEDTSSIVGMSGGPLFSFKHNESGELQYWLCAVQSRWIPNKKLIAACLMKPFAMIVRDIMRGVWKGNV